MIDTLKPNESISMDLITMSSREINFYKSKIPADVRIKLEAGSFHSVCEHLRQRSDSVQNIDLMAVSGFCRNCLAKWLVLEARKLSSTMRQTNLEKEEDAKLLSILESFGYDEAAEEVYGCSYSIWKKAHSKQASEQQMNLYKSTSSIHAKHVKDILQKQNEGGASIVTSKYYISKIPHETRSLLEAGAFTSLCDHLRNLSNEVQNIDMMTISGFCRNCIAKWLVIEARKISSDIKKSKSSDISNEDKAIIASLDAFGYDEAAEEVYGCKYSEWKILHAKKATEDQMRKYDSSKSIHAIHDKELLKPECKRPALAVNKEVKTKTFSNNLQSNVCCQDIEGFDTSSDSPHFTENNSICVPSKLIDDNSKSYVPPPAPKSRLSFSLGILTVSDRAFANEYQSGDLSGPAVEKSVLDIINSLGKTKDNQTSIICNNIQKDIVPDDMDKIKMKLSSWCNVDQTNTDSVCDIILSTGGTGFSPRDVTPEATLEIVERECRGLMAWVSSVCSRDQPLAPLSRGVAGICGKSIIVNLPGNPRGVSEVLNILFPLLLHACKDMKEG